MMKVRQTQLIHLLRLLFVGGVLGLLFFYNYSQPRILILHSYALDYTWVRNVNEGLERILKNRRDYSVWWQYMNTKNHPEFSFKQKAGILARRMIEQIKPTIIIAVDDEAQELVGKFYINHESISVVFCGVNGKLSDYGYEEVSNVTGILERVPVKAIHEALPYLVAPAALKKGVRLAYLGDKSESVRLDGQVVFGFDWAPYYLMDSILVGTFEKWKEKIHDLQGKVDAILVSNYRQLRASEKDRKFVNPKEVMQWTVQNCQIPIIGLNGFIVEDGGEMAIAASPFEQGETAAKLALKILDGANPKDLPITQTQNYLVFLHSHFSKKNQGRLPFIYEAFARGIGKYYE